QVLAALAEGRISLSVAGRLAPHLSEEDVERFLSDCAGMTKRALEEYLVRLNPQPVFDPSIRKRPTPGERPKPRSESEERASRAEEEKSAAPSPGETGAAPHPVPPSLPSPPPATPPGRITPASPGMFNFRFAASTDFRKKLERLAEVMGIVNSEKNMAEVFKRALDLALEAKDPKRRLARREARARRRDAALQSRNVAGKPRPDEVANGSCPPVERVVKHPENQSCAAPESAASTLAKSRHVPVAVRDRVLERAGHQCQFTGPDGTRCTARTGLEIEHTKPFAIFQSHDESTLEVLCRRHNALRAEQAYGAKHIQQKIEERRQVCVSSAHFASP
ncbi:MAG TPA: HNH endonuclease signature motif containing protein, partial [Planctomycetota bacterium]|nr:HNH endonuclease signature motif containing protein [Planctomycetota bacterium]